VTGCGIDWISLFKTFWELYSECCIHLPFCCMFFWALHLFVCRTAAQFAWNSQFWNTDKEVGAKGETPSEEHNFLKLQISTLILNLTLHASVTDIKKKTFPGPHSVTYCLCG